MEKKEEKKTTHRRLLVTLVLMMSLAWSMIAMAGKTGWQQRRAFGIFMTRTGLWFAMNLRNQVIHGSISMKMV